MHEIRKEGVCFGEKQEKKLGLIFFALVLFLVASPIFSLAAEVDSPAAGAEVKAVPDHEHLRKIIVAKVNGKVISMDDLTRTMDYLSSRKGPETDGPEGRGNIRQEALDRLINQELALEKAKADGLKVDTQKVDEAMSNLKNKMGGDEGYRQFLAKEQATEAGMRVEAERMLMLKLVYAREVTDKATVSESEAREVYEKEKDKYVVAEKVIVADLVFFLALNDESARKAEEILAEIRSDKDQDLFKLPARDFFIVRQAELTLKDGELYEAAKKLQLGELSGVIRTSDSFHIIKLKVFSPFKQYTFEEKKKYLISRLTKEAKQKRFKEWEAQLRKDAKIEIIDEKRE